MSTESELIDRREAIRRVSILLGGVALVGSGSLWSTACRTERASAYKGVGQFTPEHVALLDEVADTILPETKTPGAKAAQVGPFMALMVTDCYEPKDQQVFMDGMTKLDAATQKSAGTTFMKATPQQR
ncbi:MAG TPA: gluconate 2-dehydrogenase subunit 3 family protein, partial [Gemmatimonadaceae bacterium]|nr:gluconate 2-dehydrogenase subunit 3 family protein [Gemmatimonadaceae bacterium]